MKLVSVALAKPTDAKRKPPKVEPPASDVT